MCVRQGRCTLFRGLPSRLSFAGELCATGVHRSSSFGNRPTFALAESIAVGQVACREWREGEQLDFAPEPALSHVRLEPLRACQSAGSCLTPSLSALMWTLHIGKGGPMPMHWSDSRPGSISLSMTVGTWPWSLTWLWSTVLHTSRCHGIIPPCNSRCRHQGL